MKDTPPASDTASMKQAHPIRLTASMPDFYELLKTKLIGAEWPIVEKYMQDEQRVLSETGFRLTAENRLPKFTGLVSALAGMPGSTELGGAYGLLSWVRYQLIKFTHFKFDDKLVEMLEHTDLDDDIPVSYLRPPYPFTYLELGTLRNLETFIENSESGEHVLEGAYIERGMHRDVPDCLYITLTGSPLGHRDVSDDSTLSVLISLEDMDAPLSVVLEKAFYRERQHAKDLGLQLSSASTIPSTLNALKLVAKALLYLGLPEARKSLHPEKALLLQAASRVSSPAKRAKFQRKLTKTYDFVLVEATENEKRPAGSEPSGRTTKTHWRRGHYRMQAHGPMHTLRKVVFIRPMLVSGDQEVAPSTRNYVVR